MDKHALSDGVALGVDKVEFRIPYKQPPKGTIVQTSDSATHIQPPGKNSFLNHLYFAREQIIDNFKVTQPKGAIAKGKPARIIVKSRYDYSRVATVMLGLYWGNPVLTYEFNPSKLTEDGVWELNLLFEMTLPFEYLTLYTQGVIKRIEFYIDITGIGYGDLVLLDTGRRKTSQYFDTTYHGKRKSPLAATMYNKAAELKQQEPRTRIEFRVQHRDVTLQDLVESGITNPFEPFLVVPAAALETIADELKCPRLANDIRKLGLYKATKNIHARKAITQRLKQMVVPWWNHDQIWDHCRQMLRGFRPTYMVPMKMAA